MALNHPSRRRYGVDHSLLRLACFAVTLSLTVHCTSSMVAQRPVSAGTPSASAPAPTPSARASTGHTQPAAGTPSAPTPQPHLRSHIGLNLGLGGRWWDEPTTIRQLKLTSEQQRRMDSIFEANKPTLMSLYLTMQREQTLLSSLPPADLQDQSKVFAAIDRVSKARCDLEKENARILIRIRQQLAPQQLQSLDREIASLQ